MGYSERAREIEMRAEFVRQLLASPDLNGTEAALAAGYGGPAKNPRSAARAATRLLKREDVRAEIEKAQAERAARTEITADKVLLRLWAIATADPNDLVQYRRNACRYCHGVGHAYQWIDEAEWGHARDKAEKRHGVKPDNAGGYGYSFHVEPAPDCPRCNGEGIGQAHFADTRRIKGPARMLFAGVKEGRDGLEFKLHDQMAAIDKLMRHLGMFKESVEHKHTFEQMSDDEIERQIAAFERGENEA